MMSSATPPASPVDSVRAAFAEVSLNTPAAHALVVAKESAETQRSPAAPAGALVSSERVVSTPELDESAAALAAAEAELAKLREEHSELERKKHEATMQQMMIYIPQLLEYLKDLAARGITLDALDAETRLALKQLEQKVLELLER